MAEDLLKNEFMWQEQQKKEKLYKNWKLYAVALGIIVIGLGVGLGVGLSTTHNQQTTPINLNTLDNVISGTEGMTADDAFQAFVSNSKITLKQDNVEISNFTKPTYTTEGALTITAKENSKKYTGTITLTINAIGQINLNALNLTFPSIPSTENINAESVFGIFTYYNPTIAKYVEAGTFTKPTYTTGGSLIINAIKDSKYTGSVEVNIPKLVQIALSTLNTAAIDGIQDMTADDAFNAFLANNNNITDLKDNVELSFDAPKYISTGSLTITAKPNTKYSGQITITINAIKQTNLENLPNIVKEVENTTTINNALETFLNANKDMYPDLENNVTFDKSSFTAPGYTTTGSYVIIANETGKYTGTITVTINEIGQTKLEELNLNTNLTGTEAIQNDETGKAAFKAFLDANSTITDLKDNIEIGTFIAPTYTTEGSLIINAISDGKYTGFIKITFSILQISEEQIINEINNASYSIETIMNSSASSVTDQINSEFIQKQLTGEINKAFNANKFTFNKITINGTNLQDNDLTTIGTITAKINYNYDSIQNQETNLTININQLQLQDILKDFQFKDNNGIENFLNSNDQSTIESQILNFLNISSLSDAGLVLENQTSNSVVLKATEDSKNYQGEITLTWNLKLFEIWGINTDLGIIDPNNSQAELKGYFYLDNTNSIKYFDVYGYEKPGESNDVSRYESLHSFTFQNENGTSKEFTFSNAQKTNEIAAEFGSFDLTDSTTVTITSQVYANARIFNSETDQWVGLNGPTTLLITNLGQLITINN